MRDWWQRRRERRARERAVRAQLLDEYEEKLESRDPDVLDTSRDWADNDGAPWRFEVWIALGFVVLVVGVGVLIALFEGIQTLMGE